MQTLQKELFTPFRNNIQFLQKEPCRPFRKNFSVPLEGTVQSLQKEPCRLFKKNFLLHLKRTFLVSLEGTLQTLQKEIFRIFRKNLRLSNFLDYFYQNTLFCMYYCKVQFITFSYTNNVNAILKIDCVFLFFITLAGLLLKLLLRTQEQPQHMNKICPRKDFDRI